MLELLGRYRIEMPLGEGGTGSVFVGYDTDGERRVAIKVLRDAVQTNQARMVTLVPHPNVVCVYEIGSHHNHDFIAMELVDGLTLAEWLGEPRSMADILDAFVAAGRGLAHAHAHDLVHRDFKPSNVLRSAAGRFAVMDFGLVPTLARGSNPRLSQLGVMLDAAAYMAPEQWNGAAITPATDQYAFCVSLWEALVGTRPYADRAAAEHGPRELDATRLPRALRPILLRGLEPVPAMRWPSMTALLAHLSRVRGGRRRWLVPVAIGLIAAAFEAVVLLAA